MSRNPSIGTDQQLSRSLKFFGRRPKNPERRIEHAIGWVRLAECVLLRLGVSLKKTIGTRGESRPGPFYEKFAGAGAGIHHLPIQTSHFVWPSQVDGWMARSFGHSGRCTAVERLDHLAISQMMGSLQRVGERRVVRDSQCMEDGRADIGG